MRYGFMVLVLAAANVACGGVVSISEWHHVSGWAGFEEYQSYDLSAAYPISGSVSGIGYGGSPVTASSSAGDYAVRASAAGAIFSGGARAESTYVFSPDYPVLEIQIVGHTGYYSWDGNVVQYRLTDRTLDEVILSYTSSDSQDYEWIVVDASHRVGVDIAHEYELFLSVVVFVGDAGGTGSELTAEIACVPVPGAFLLGSVGAGAVCWHRRRRCRRA